MFSGKTSSAAAPATSGPIRSARSAAACPSALHHGDGLLVGEAAHRLTVVKHKENLYKKLRVHDRVTAINKARFLGLISPEPPVG